MPPARGSDLILRDDKGWTNASGMTYTEREETKYRWGTQSILSSREQGKRSAM